MTTYPKVKRLLEIRQDFSFALRRKAYTCVIDLPANTQETFTVPTGASCIFFSANCDFWADYDPGSGSIAVPGASITDGSAPELNPAVAIVDDVTTIYLISTAGGLVSMLVYF